MADRPTIRWGSEGDAVVELQSRLTALGYATGPIDGDFGSLTDGAARQFQADHGLVVDGIVGPMTWAMLEQYGDPGGAGGQSHVVFVEEPAVADGVLSYRAARQDGAPIAAGAHVDFWSIEAPDNPMLASDTVTVPFTDTTDGTYAVSLPLPALQPGTYTAHVGLTITAGSSEVGHATFAVGGGVADPHVVFVQEPVVSGRTLTYRAARGDRAPIAAGSHVDMWNIEGDGNPMLASDTITVPFADAHDGVYDVSLGLPELEPGVYTVHVGLTITAGSSEVGHATFTV